MSSHFSRTQRKLAVCAKENVGKKVEVRSKSTWIVVSCTSIDEVIKLTQADDLDAVALPFDAMNGKARDMLLQLTQLQKNEKPVLVSYADFNPDWIENLVFGLGANIHMRGELKLDEVVQALDAHIRNELPASA